MVRSAFLEVRVLSWCGRVGSAFGKWAGRWDMTKLMYEPDSALSELGVSVSYLRIDCGNHQRIHCVC